MKFIVKDFISDKYAKAINILNDNLKENYYVFYGVRLSEILFPASDYGTGDFFKEFEEINNVTLPLVVFEINEREPVIVIGFDEINGAILIEKSGIKVLVIDNLSALLTNETLGVFFK
nr:DNA distortion polypeptide 3 [Escherichia coli]